MPTPPRQPEMRERVHRALFSKPVEDLSRTPRALALGEPRQVHSAGDSSASGCGQEGRGSARVGIFTEGRMSSGASVVHASSTQPAVMGQAAERRRWLHSIHPRPAAIQAPPRHARAPDGHDGASEPRSGVHRRPHETHAPAAAGEAGGGEDPPSLGPLLLRGGEKPGEGGARAWARASRGRGGRGGRACREQGSRDCRRLPRCARDGLGQRARPRRGSPQPSCDASTRTGWARREGRHRARGRVAARVARSTAITAPHRAWNGG